MRQSFCVSAHECRSIENARGKWVFANEGDYMDYSACRAFVGGGCDDGRGVAIGRFKEGIWGVSDRFISDGVVPRRTIDKSIKRARDALTKIEFYGKITVERKEMGANKCENISIFYLI